MKASVKSHSSPFIVHHSHELLRWMRSVSVLLSLMRLSTTSRIIFSAMATSSQMSNFLPAGVSDLKMTVYICSFVTPFHFLGSSMLNVSQCKKRFATLTNPSPILR